MPGFKLSWLRLGPGGAQGVKHGKDSLRAVRQLCNCAFASPAVWAKQRIGSEVPSRTKAGPTLQPAARRDDRIESAA